ncbi:unnamed protein product [Laminaria digitata]
MRAQLGLELVSGTPSFTNFTPEFTDTLDYVFIEGGAGTGRRRGGETVAPMPEEGVLRAVTPGLPSETYPSDHVSLVVDLALWT